MKEYLYDEEPFEENINTDGCGYCWDFKKNISKELYFLDRANNMRICKYCPYCGRKYNIGE